MELILCMLRLEFNTDIMDSVKYDCVIPSVAPKRGHVMKKHDLIWYQT